jgi:putative glutamine amidotransferase
MSLHLSLYTFILLWSFASLGVELQSWVPSSDGVRFIIPDRGLGDEEMGRYFSLVNQESGLETLRAKPEVAPIAPNSQLPLLRGQHSSLQADEVSRPRFLVITNEFRELYGEPFNQRAKNIERRLHSHGAQAYFLPPVHDIALTPEERVAYHQRLVNSFDAILIMGGDDITPGLYGEPTTFARGTNLFRDQSELRFVRHFIEAQEGMSFGICRGHQMCGVAHGKKLVQDIQLERYAAHEHLDGAHFISTDREAMFFSGFEDERLFVNSLHHQAVDIHPYDPDLRITAFSFDERPVVEAMEFRSGMGASFQFHPELMDDEVGVSIMRRMVALARENKIRKASCRELLGVLSP